MDIFERINNVVVSSIASNSKKPTHIFLGIKQQGEVYRSAEAKQHLKLLSGGVRTLDDLIYIREDHKDDYLAVGILDEYESDKK